MAIGSEYEDVVNRAYPDLFELESMVRALDHEINQAANKHPELEIICKRFSDELSSMYRSWMFSIHYDVSGEANNMKKTFGLPDWVIEQLHEEGLSFK